MSQLEAFRSEVEAFLGRTQLGPTQFGKDAVNDPNFISDLRSGRAPSLTTVDRVLTFIRSKEQKTTVSTSRRSRAAA